MRSTLKITRRILAITILLGLAACQTTNQPKVILSTKSAVELRAMQSRAFDTPDGRKTLRAVLATLQDLGYTIDKVEPAAGSVSATKLSFLRLSTSVYPRGETQTLVRANAFVKTSPQAVDNQVDDPEFYQKYFFDPLAKALFLSALQVEDPPEAQQASVEAPPESR